MRINYLLIIISIISLVQELSAQDYQRKAADVLREQILSEAEWALKQQPVTVTASSSPRSAGTKNDFFSEADYFWPDSLNPEGPHQKDVMYWENWPVAQPFLLFGAQAFGKDDWFSTWKNLDHKPEVVEVVRNLPIRNPIIWFN